MITFSIIIPTYKRENHLINLLDSFKNKLTKASCEIIIVEQVQNHKKQFLAKAKQLKIKTTYIFLTKANTPRAKNVGASKACGEYLIFFDDDVLLQTPIVAFKKSFRIKHVVAVNGRSVAKNQKEEIGKRDVGQITWFGKFTDGYSSKIPQKITTFIGCNVCWRKDIFLALGGFDQQFSGNAIREEADLSLRAKNKGYTLYFNPEVEIFHVRAETGGTRKTEGRIQWYFDFFSNETYFFLKYFPKSRIPLILATRFEWIFRCMLGFGREVSVRSFVTPWMGMLDGCKKYRRWQHENRN